MDLRLAEHIASEGIVNNLYHIIRNTLVDLKWITIHESSGSYRIETAIGFDDDLVLNEVLEHLRTRAADYDEFSDLLEVEIRQMLVTLRLDRIKRMTLRRKRTPTCKITAEEYADMYSQNIDVSETDEKDVQEGIEMKCTNTISDRKNHGVEKSLRKRRRLKEDYDHQDQDQDQEEKRRIKRKKSNTTSDHKKKKNKSTRKKNNGVKRASKNGPEPPLNPPSWLRELIEEMGGFGERLVIQKYLSTSDIKTNQNRLSMPVLQLQCPDDFLTEEESRDVWVRKEDDNKRIKGINVPVYDSRESKSELSLRKWEYPSSISYVFAGKWMDFVDKNACKKGHLVQVRFFRSGNGIPCFAFINFTKETPSSSSAIAADAASPVAEEDQPATGDTAAC